MRRSLSIFPVMISIFLVIALVFPLSASAVDCWYYNTYGEHDFEMTNVGLPGCTVDGYYILECRQCGYSVQQITQKAYGHTWKLIASENATCEKSGYRKYQCTECYQEYTQTISATGHQEEIIETLQAATCQQEGSVRVKCSVCGAIRTRSTSRTDHLYGDWQILQPATDHSMGQRTRTCSVCGQSEPAQAYYPEGTLYRGLRQNEDVRSLQQALIDLGILSDVADGSFGPKTEQAVKDFQQLAGAEVTGIAYPQTLDLLNRQLLGDLQPEEEEIPKHCCVLTDENDNTRVVFCEKHLHIPDALPIPAINDDGSFLLEREAELWKAEIESLYDQLSAHLEGEKLVELANAKSSFFIMISMQKKQWDFNFKDQPETAARKLRDAYAEQCAYLCAMAYDLDPENAE